MRTRRARLVTAASLLAVVGLAVGLGITLTGSDGAKRGPRTIVLTASGVVSFAKTHGSPLYWLGPQIGSDYQVTSSPDGRIFLRYVPASVRAGAPRPYVSV